MDAVAIFQSIFDKYVEQYMAGDAAGSAEFYTHDATIYSPFGLPVCGRNALIDAHLEWFQEGEINKKVEILEARADGGIGFCTARYSADLPQDGGSLIHDTGTSLNTFERQGDGTWKIKHTSLNTLELEE